MNAVLAAPKVLSWSESTSYEEQRIGDEFDLLVRSVFDLHVDRAAVLETTDPSHFDEAADRVVRAPRAIRRLLWPSPSRTVSTRAFLEHALSIELFLVASGREGRDREITGWTADGRARVRSDGTVVAQPVVAGFDAVIDLDSPHARALDLSGGPVPHDPPRASMSADVADATVERIASAWHLIERIAPPAAQRLQRWIAVVVAQCEPSGTFWSGSNGHYIGRAALTNPAAPRVSVSEVADALVHEGIHGLLAQHETLQAWVTDPALFSDRPAIRSPWTRNMLPVRQYLQACFVWYGLAMFWAEAIGAVDVDGDETTRLFARAVRGFLEVELVAELQPWASVIDSHILRTIDEMQLVIRSLVR